MIGACRHGWAEVTKGKYALFRTPTGATADKKKKVIGKLMKRGRKAKKEGRLKDARAYFTRAKELNNSLDFWSNIGGADPAYALDEVNEALDQRGEGTSRKDSLEDGSQKSSKPKYLRSGGTTRTDSSDASSEAEATDNATMTSEYQQMTRDRASTIVDQYGSVPGGVTLEGNGKGIKNIRRATYESSKRIIVLNGKIDYRIPVTPKEMKAILLAIAENDRIGVSMVSEYTTYGALPKDGRVSLMLRQTDWFLAHLAYGWEKKYRDYKIANGEELKKRDDEFGNVMCYFRFCNYKFDIVDSECVLESWSFFPTLIPIKVGEHAEDGGGLPDFEAIEKQDYSENLLHNIKHIANNADYYMRERMMRIVKCYGEAAAFARAIKKEGIDLRDLASSM